MDIPVLPDRFIPLASDHGGYFIRGSAVIDLKLLQFPCIVSISARFSPGTGAY
jgi:hypothetical protein